MELGSSEPLVRPTPIPFVFSSCPIMSTAGDSRAEIVPGAETKVRTRLCFTSLARSTMTSWPWTSSAFRNGTYTSTGPSCRTTSTPSLSLIFTFHPPGGECHWDKRTGRRTRTKVVHSDDIARVTCACPPGRERVVYYSYLMAYIRDSGISPGVLCIFGPLREPRIALLQKSRETVTLEALDARCEKIKNWIS